MKRVVLLVAILLIVNWMARSQTQAECKKVSRPFSAELCFPKESSYQDGYIKLKLGNKAPVIDEVKVWDKTLMWPPYIIGPPYYGSGQRTRPTSSTEKVFKLNEMFLTDGSPPKLFTGKHSYDFEARSNDGRTVRFTGIVIDLKEPK